MRAVIRTGVSNLAVTSNLAVPKKNAEEEGRGKHRESKRAPEVRPAWAG